MPACYQRATERNLLSSLSAAFHLHANRVFAFREKSGNPCDSQGPTCERIRLHHPESQGLRGFDGRRKECEGGWAAMFHESI